MGQAKENLEKTPTLLLPASFLAKYRPWSKIKAVPGAPVPVKASPEVKISGLGQMPERTPQNYKLIPISSVKPDKAVIDSPLSATPPNAPKNLKSTMEEYIRSTPDVPTKALPVLDTNIKWAMSSLVPVFDNDEQKRWAQHNNISKGSYFWEHTVRFLPNPTEKNLYRTVMIDYIPTDATYEDVLAHLRTGALELIQIFPPLPGSTDYLTARVVFAYELPAVSMMMQFEKRLREGNPIRIKGGHVRFWQVYVLPQGVFPRP